jgi:hypothetical protein
VQGSGCGKACVACVKASNGFSQVEEEISDTNQCACIITFNPTNSSIIIECTANIPDFDSSPHSSSAIISTLYLSTSDQFHVPQNASMVFTPMQTLTPKLFPSYVTTINSTYPTFTATKKKYKPVTQKVWPVITELPDLFRIIRNIVGDPLADMPKLNPHPPPFAPSPLLFARTKGHRQQKPFLAISYGLKNVSLMHDFIRNHDTAFAWNENERGSFRPNFFPPIEFPVIPHTPWVERNIPIPPGIYEEVCGMLKKKIEAGVYEPSNSVLQVSVVLRHKERWKITTLSSQPRTSQQSHYTALRHRPDPRTYRRTIRRIMPVVVCWTYMWHLTKGKSQNLREISLPFRPLLAHFASSPFQWVG